MTDGRLILPAAGRTPLGREEISIRTGRPKNGGFLLMVERRMGGMVRTAKPVIARATDTCLEENDLMDPRVNAKLEELKMNGSEFHRSLSGSGSIIVKDPDGDVCCILKKKGNGELSATTWLTPYTLRERSGRIATTAGLEKTF